MNKETILSNDKCMVAFIFDSYGFNTNIYGAASIDMIFKGGELKENQFKIVVSFGDIIDYNIFSDINTLIVNNKLCSINNTQTKIYYYPYVILMEDIQIHIVTKLDKRMKKECNAYLGVTSIDIESHDQRKQFWKRLIRSFSIEKDVCTIFAEGIDDFMFRENIINAGYIIHYDGFSYDANFVNNSYLFSTRQSSFIQRTDQIKYVDGKNDSSRNINKMNMALVKEVEIAGVNIWKAIEDINKVHLTKNNTSVLVDYVFTSFYQAAQGIERLLKILIELVVYTDKNSENKRTDKLLYSHNHIALVSYLETKGVIKLDKSSRNLVNILYRFYSQVRYHRYID
ncbi:MAG: hypothetical protein K6F77_02605, partial [Lachnospiraceae bacterium]|nr:hypothetical protein [Lachnospiraceae bacterium]